MKIVCFSLKSVAVDFPSSSLHLPSCAGLWPRHAPKRTRETGYFQMQRLWSGGFLTSGLSPVSPVFAL